MISTKLFSNERDFQKETVTALVPLLSPGSDFSCSREQEDGELL